MAGGQLIDNDGLLQLLTLMAKWQLLYGQGTDPLAANKDGCGPQEATGALNVSHNYYVNFRFLFTTRNYNQCLILCLELIKLL